MDFLDKHFDTAFSAPDGIKKLRQLILTLAMQGKLVQQDPSDQPAPELLKEIQAEKEKLIADGKIKKQKALPPIKPDEIPYELPNNWEWVRLGNIALYNGRQNAKPNEIDKNTWLLDLEDIEKDTSRLLYKARYSERLSKSNKSVFHKGDILYGKLRPYLNKIIVADDNGVCTTEIVPIVLFGNISPYFFLMSLKRPSYLKYVDSLMYGVKMPRLGTGDANMSIHPLPPLAEQKRIVKKIDQLMARCDELEKLKNEKEQKRLDVHKSAIHRLLNTEEINGSWSFIKDNFNELYSVKENVTELRKAILSLAMQGKLVPQDPSDQPASELLKEIQAEKQKLIKEGKIKKQKPIPPIKPEETKYEIPENWVWARLDNLVGLHDGSVRRGPFGSAITKSMFVPKGPDTYKIYEQKNAIKKDASLGEYDITQEHYEKLSNFTVESGDIIISCAGTIGETYILPENIDKGIINQALLKININNMVMTDMFFLKIFESLTKKQVNEQAMGSAMKNMVSLNHLRSNVLFPLPPLAEQKRIVGKIDQLMAMCDELEAQISASEATQTSLLNSIMAQV